MNAACVMWMKVIQFNLCFRALENSAANLDHYFCRLTYSKEP